MTDFLTDSDLERAERQIEKTEEVASDLLEAEFLLKQVRRKIHFLNSEFPVSASFFLHY